MLGSSGDTADTNQRFPTAQTALPGGRETSKLRLAKLPSMLLPVQGRKRKPEDKVGRWGVGVGTGSSSSLQDPQLLPAASLTHVAGRDKLSAINNETSTF